MHSSQIVERGKIYKVKEEIEDFKLEGGIISYLVSSMFFHPSVSMLPSKLHIFTSE